MTTSDYYRASIQDALEYIDQRLADKFSVADVAEAASFSEYHFHRLFPAFTGESIYQYVRNRRLEKAARLLAEKPNIRLLDLAIEVGFETHSAFSRAFKQQFDISPFQFRKSTQRLEDILSRSPSVTIPADIINLAPTFQNLPSLHFSFRVAKGTSAGQFFNDQRPDAEFSEIIQHSGNDLIGIVSAFPTTPQSLNDSSAEVWYGGLFTSTVINQQGSHSIRIEAGKWAAFEYEGAYEYLHQMWNQIYRAWLPNSNQTLRETLPFEMYLNNPQKIAPAKLLTQIWLPIE